MANCGASQVIREFIFHGRRLRLDTGSNGDSRIRLDSVEHDIACEELAPGSFLLQNSSGRYRARVARQKDRVFVWLQGRIFEFQIPSSDESGAHSGEKPSDVRAPMPGTLIKLSVNVGDSVEEDQVVAVLEAMKMEHQLRAPRTGKVKSVAGTIGSVIEADAVIITLEPAE
jgi:biotin carboxyl carrier protein